MWTRGGGGGPTNPPTTPPTQPPGGGFDAYSQIQAEAFQAQNGVIVEACSEGGQNIGALRNGDWVQFNNVNFGSTPARDFVARSRGRRRRVSGSSVPSTA